jgi:hypothetical protein
VRTRAALLSRALLKPPRQAAATLRENLTASWNQITAAEKKAWLQANGLS